MEATLSFPLLRDGPRSNSLNKLLPMTLDITNVYFTSLDFAHAFIFK